MKKPNLAQKDLMYDESRDHVYYEMEGGGRYIVYRGGDSRVVNALLSYADLIDALTMFVNNVECTPATWLDEEVEEAKKALQKAGVKKQ